MLENKNGEPVSGVKFNFYSSEGVLLHELETDNDGFIGLVNLIKDNDSIFYVEQSGVATPRRFYMRIGKDDIYRIDLVINNEGVIE